MVQGFFHQLYTREGTEEPKSQRLAGCEWGMHIIGDFIHGGPVGASSPACKH